ncbi:phage integrase N-terminal domain-containing protein [Legionella shakespearei]|uniref:Putative integrase n=1 Tax=Legionella shakespearei DSM 23087 TaxID=1122169 RepID=A0A0W0YLX8_9GAMM|nr:phage integrase N-terminal domain-containing protein [Legionella shakespearei]KTD57885.1 putative integrase [Legionella shakespearei DSM 23087]
MRKQSLRQEANLILSSNRGSFRERKYRRYVIYKMINNLFTVGKVPPNWKCIDATHMQLLVKHWHQQKIKPSTMMNYMTIIRKFLRTVGNETTNIDNQSLGIIASRKSHKRVNIPIERWQKIDEPVARLLLNLQIHFGLTLSEAMRLRSDVHVHKDKLWLTRELTFNSMDRCVPFRTDVQTKIIDEFILATDDLSTLIERYGYRSLCFAWNHALKKLRIPVKKSCRYLYAQLMFKELSSTYDKDELTKLLMDEMGLTSRISMWNYFNNK